MIRRLITITLILWLGGLGCLLGCKMGAQAASAPSAQQATVQDDSACPLSAMGDDCCSQQESVDNNSASLSNQPAGAYTIMCCPLARQAAASAYKAQVISAPALIAANLFSTKPRGNTFARATNQMRALDRGGTYMRCCALLI